MKLWKHHLYDRSQGPHYLLPPSTPAGVQATLALTLLQSLDRLIRTHQSVLTYIVAHCSNRR